jgi:hypothetical protein
MAYVYRHIRLDKNQPFYIGVGTYDTYKRAYDKKNRNLHWNNIVKKTDYEVDILIDGLSEKDAFAKEIEFISLYGKSCNGGLLCNITDGGEGGFLSEEVNEKRKLALLGRKLPSHIKEKIRIKAIGRKASFLTKEKMSEIHKKNGTGIWLKSKGHQNGNAKSISQFDLDGNFIKTWECSAYACKELLINKSSLSSVLNGNQKTAGGFIWKFHKIKSNGKTSYVNIT